MSLGIKKEITVGQVLVVAIAFLTFLGAAWTTYSEVQQIKKDVATFASKESVTALRSDITLIRSDIGDIKTLVYLYVRRTTGASKDSVLDAPAMKILARIDSALSATK